MPTMNEYATELFMGVYSSLLHLDTFSLPLEKVCLDECDRQVLLGRDFIEALVRWAYIFPGKIDMIDTTIIRDVRRIIKRHTKWFILFVGVCVIDRSSPMTLYEIEEGIDLMMMKFGGVDRHLDFWLDVINQSGEVQLLRMVVANNLAKNGF